MTQLRRVPIVENGEPLVNYLELGPELREDRPRFKYQRASLLRQSVAAALIRANDRLLRQGYRLHVIEGWRSPRIQIRMYRSTWIRFRALHPEMSESAMRRLVNRYTAPMNERVPPPHSTGGAMDLALYSFAGEELEIHAPFEAFDVRSFSTEAKGITDLARRHRALMAEALTAEGITNYPSEYWHWSYGDQGWAYRGGHPHALYAATHGPCVEVSDEPLELAD